MNTLNTPQKRALFLPLEGLMEEDHGAVRTRKASRKAQTSTSLWVLTRVPLRPPALLCPTFCSPPRCLPISLLAQKVPLLPRQTGGGRGGFTLQAQPDSTPGHLPERLRTHCSHAQPKPWGSSLQRTELTRVSPSPSHAPR